MSNYAVETDVTSGDIVGVGRRFDYHLSADDAINGFFVEVSSSVPVPGPILVDIYHDFDRLTDAEMVAAKAGATFYDINDGLPSTQYIGSVEFNFTVYTRNLVLIKPGYILDKVIPLPDVFLPVFGFRLNATDFKLDTVNITKRGLK